MQKKPDPKIPFGPHREPWESLLPAEARDKKGNPLPLPPSADPIEAYRGSSAAFPFEEDLLEERFVELPPVGLGRLEKRRALGKMRRYMNDQRKQFMGYQVVEQQTYRDVRPFLDMTLNNIGDPFVDGYFTVNAKPAERAVLDFFASLWHAEWPSQPSLPDSYWGYVLSMGSTEGNLYAVLNARDYLSGCKLVPDPAPKGRRSRGHTLVRPAVSKGNPNEFTPIAFYSEDTHYSLMKAVHAMNVKTFYEVGMTEKYRDHCPLDEYKGTGRWPEMVPSKKPTKEHPIGDGTIDIDALVKLVEFFAKEGYPIFVVLNYGTTFKGAYDDVKAAGEALMRVFEAHHLDKRCIRYADDEDGGKVCIDSRTGYWIHVDGALGASFMPFIEMLHRHGKQPRSGPQFDFRLPFVQSLVMSGHKWPGTPMPTGVYMSKRKYLVSPPDAPSYLGSPDSTFAGSRNGLSAMALWDLIAENGYPNFLRRAQRTLEMAEYAHKKLSKVAERVKKRDNLDIWLQRSDLSTAVIFRKPRDEIMFKYSLCVADADRAWVNGQVVPVNRTYVHLFCLWDGTIPY